MLNYPNCKTNPLYLIIFCLEYNVLTKIACLLNISSVSRKQNILIVDDEPNILIILDEILSKTARVEKAATGDEALRVLETFAADLVLLDIMMPGSNGYEICKKIRANTKLGHIRIILLSGGVMVEDRLKGYEAGADDYISKPFIEKELLAKVQVFLRLVDAERSLFDHNVTLEQKVKIRTEQLLKSEKAAFLGVHTAEIVHNLKNPLAILKGTLSSLEKNYPTEPKVKTAMSALERMHDIIRTILISGRQNEDLSVQAVNLNDIIKTELKLLETDDFFKYQVRLTQNFRDIPTVEGVPTYFSQCFGNLIKNAIESMHGREKKELRVDTRLFDDHEIVVEISDTGCGISPENLPQIFDPFFSTKPIQATGDEPTGTGLGLASVQRMLQTYNAKIQFESKLGVQTLVRVKIPLLRKKSEKKFSAPAYPLNENERLASLNKYRVLDSTSEKVFEDLCFLARAICKTPISAISLIDSNRQWFKSTVGLGDTKETSREISFCGHAIHSVAPFVVEDALLDERFVYNPLVTGRPNIRFYAGFPLVNSEDYALGTLCVVDRQPRKLTADALQCLQLVARQVMNHLEWHKSVRMGETETLPILLSRLENGLKEIQGSAQGLEKMHDRGYFL